MSAPEFVPKSARFLVTGSNGFIGVRVVQTLLEQGYFRIRCFTRPSSRCAKLQELIARFPDAEIELVAGDLIARGDCDRAAKDVAVIIHLAAGFEKSFAGAFMNSALATRNLLDSFCQLGLPCRFVNVSSFAVYSNLALRRGELLTEDCPLETASQERCDAYGFGKLKQEELVRQYGRERGLPWVILRPGAVFGPGKKDLSGRVGINTFGFFLHLGGGNQIPLTYVDNCAEAIVLAALTPGIDGEVFNVVDDELWTSRQLFRAYKQKVKTFSISIPYFLTATFCRWWERYARKSQYQVPAIFNRRRCSAEWKGNCYSNAKLKQKLGWQPRVKMSDAVASYLSQFDGV